MSKKFTDSQKEVFKRLVLDTILQRLDIDESLDYINTKIKAKYDLEIGPDYVKRIKTELKQNSQKELNHLRKDRLSYMNHLFFERIDEVKNMQRKLWEIITSNQEDKPEVAVKCISELQKLSQSLCQMYEMLPLLGQLPSNAFAGLVEDDNNGGGETPDSVITASQPTRFIWKTLSGFIFNMTLFSPGDLKGYLSLPIYFFAILSMCSSAASLLQGLNQLHLDIRKYLHDI